MADNKKDILQHGLNAAKAKASDSEEKKYAEELSSELSGSAMKGASKSAKK